jgi:hypothetical protein
MIEEGMTQQHISHDALSDEELLADVKRFAAAERGATAALIRSLIELDARRLYLREGFSSLFTYCTQALHLAEGAAYNRIEAARTAARFPMILDAIAEGAITLTTVRLLAPHLSEDNHRDVLTSARHKSKHEVERLVAGLNPKPPVPTVIRKLPMSRVVGCSLLPAAPVTSPIETGATTASRVPPAPAARAADSTAWRSGVSPLAPERFKIQLTISGETHAKLRRVQDLIRHTNPSGELAEIFDRALTLLLEDLERRRCAATPSPRPAGGGTMWSRHIPATVKREVWRRDQGRCAFVGTDGRCGETGFLEFHHVEPHAIGGVSTAENIQLRCRAHNVYEARLFFGDDAPLNMRPE